MTSNLDEPRGNAADADGERGTGVKEVTGGLTIPPFKLPQQEKYATPCDGSQFWFKRPTTPRKQLGTSQELGDSASKPLI